MAAKPFNNPFEKLKGMAKAAEQEAKAKAAAARRPLPPPVRVEPPAPRVKTEEELWAEAVSGAKRVERGADVTPAPPPPPIASGPVFHPDLEAIDELRALVAGDAPFDLSDTEEYIEGRISGLDPSIARKLRRGDFAVQGHIDLHGMTREEAKQAVDAFLKKSRAAGKRCVVVVHGRGLHSKDQLPVLKDALKTWLATNRFGRHVLAFATARPGDGGGGAIYVLLRRAGK